MIYFSYDDQFQFVLPGVETFGKNAVVCGRSKNVGMPIAIFLHGDADNGNDAGNILDVYLTKLKES